MSKESKKQLLPPKYKDIVVTSLKAVTVLSVPGTFVPFLDEAALPAIWGKMIFDIVERSGKPMSMQMALKLASGVILGLVAHKTAHVIIIKALAWTGAGAVVSLPLNIVIHGLFTYRLGKIMIRDFERDGTTFDDVVRYAVVIIPQLIPVPTPAELHDLSVSFL